MIYITGTTGFVGNSILRHLATSGEEVSPLGRKELANINLIKPNTYENTLIHTAWAGVYGKYRNDEIQYTNLELIDHLIRITDNLKITKIIAFGSQAEYGPVNRPVTENSPINPSTLYGRIKVEVLTKLQQHCIVNNIELIWLRLFDPYGPGDRPEWFLPYVTRCFLQDISPKLTSCTQIWDYIHIQDVLNCVHKLISSNRSINGIYNLSSNKPVSLRSIVNEILHQANPPTAVPHFGAVPHRQDQIYYMHGINDKLCNAIDWQPHVTLEEGIKSVIMSEGLELLIAK